MTGVLICIQTYWSLDVLPLKGEIEWDVNGIGYLTFLCATYRSLFLTSGLELVRLCDLLFLLRPKILPTCLQLEKSYLLESYKTHIFQNAYIFSSKFQERIIEGLNVTHLIHLVSSNLRLVLISLSDIESAPNGLGLILGGRIKGHIRNRSLAKMNALCVTSFKNRILDIGYKTSISSLGLLGLKVGIIL